MAELKQLLMALERHYGRPAMPVAKGPFELVIWENACYLLPEVRRAEVFATLRERVGINAEAIWKAPQDVLLPIAVRGGMRPETRVFRWREIARITLEQFGGDLSRIMEWEYAKAKKALKQFPSIGDPGAEKILMYCGMASGLPLESNGLRVLTRVGFGRVHLKNYGAMYRSVQDAIAGELPESAEKLSRAHLVLQAHGKGLCKTSRPACCECPVREMCRSAE